MFSGSLGILPIYAVDSNVNQQLPESLLSHPLDDRYYRDRVPDWSKVKTPFLSAANWGGVGLHPRGNFEGFMNAASDLKWLEAHGNTHWAHFYSRYGETLQKRFFAHFLKGEKNGWDLQPKVQLQLRHPDRFEERHENEWPLARTQWTPYYLQPADKGLATSTPAGDTTLVYETTGDGYTFSTPPVTQDIEITGPVAAKLWLSSDTTDADVFIALRVYDPAGKEVVFIGSNDPRVPVGRPGKILCLICTHLRNHAAENVSFLFCRSFLRAFFLSQNLHCRVVNHQHFQSGDHYVCISGNLSGCRAIIDGNAGYWSC